MKSALSIIIGGLAISVSYTEPATAFLYCSEASRPYIPSGWYEEHWQMQTAQSDVDRYLAEIRNYQQCLIEAINDGDREAQSVLDEWSNAVSAYNSQ